MKKYDTMPDQKFVFGSVQIVANLIDTLLERELKDYDLTSRQWFMTTVIHNSFDKPPTIKEVAAAMGSSHQNVKQVALKLAQKGLVLLEKDEKDARITRIRLTEQSGKLSHALETRAAAFTNELFKTIQPEEMAQARLVLEKMMRNLSGMAQSGK